MDRGIQQDGAIPLTTDILSAQQNAMIAIGYLTQSVLGTNTVVDGLVCGPTSPASMVVNVGPGSITSLTTIDTTAYGDLSTNSNPLLKTGINTTTTPFTLTAPTTSGQSINYLIEAAFQEADGTPIVLPYYNAANPAVPFSGPNGSGTAVNTVRAQKVALQLKAGAAATTGSQTTPAVDSGWTGLYVVTVSNGMTVITAGAISTYAGAPFVDALKTGRGIRAGRLLNVQTFLSSSTYTPTPGTNAIEVEVQAAGGGAAGAPATGASQNSAGGGGGGGAYAWSRITSGITTTSVTVGAAGGTTVGGNGTAGGSSAFGTITANGGNGGATAGPSGATAFYAPGGAGGVAGSSGQINVPGTSGPGSLVVSSQGVALPPVMGQGNPPYYGSGGFPVANPASASASAGNNGVQGYVRIKEYA